MVDIDHRNNSWPFSRAFDNAELISAKRGDSFGIGGITPQYSALSRTRHNGGLIIRTTLVECRVQERYPARRPFHTSEREVAPSATNSRPPAVLRLKAIYAQL